MVEVYQVEEGQEEVELQGVVVVGAAGDYFSEFLLLGLVDVGLQLQQQWQLQLLQLWQHLQL